MARKKEGSDVSVDTVISRYGGLGGGVLGILETLSFLFYVFISITSEVTYYE